MKQQIEEKLAALVAERDKVLSILDQLQKDYEMYRSRVLELNGSIQATQEMFQMIGETCGDTESKTETGSAPDQD